MKIFRSFILALSFLISSVSYAQETSKAATKMNKEVKEIISLGKDAIIVLALNLIDEEVNAKDFRQTKIMTNGKEIYVSFINPIKFLPINSNFYFDVGVNISSGVIYKNSITNPPEFSNEKKITFYKETPIIRKHITFVIESINNIDISNLNNFEGEMIIRENKEFYAVNVISKFQESWYKVKKKSGEKYDENHAHLEPLPFEIEEKPKFREINFTKNKK